MKVLAISGSLRKESHNTLLLRAAADVAPADIEFEIFKDLELVPPYNEDRDSEDPATGVVALREAIADADAVLFATPEYNSSIPGQLKNAVDWASRPFGESSLRGKSVAVIGAGPGQYGGLWAQAELRKALGTAGARVLDSELAVPRSDTKFGPDGKLQDDQLRSRLLTVLNELVESTQPVVVG